MQNLKLSLINCYGIRQLNASLDYSQSSVVAIYAPNGAMKSSLANTFQDIADGLNSKDRIFQSRTTHREVRDETDSEIDASSILVLRPFEDPIQQNGDTATLLVNQALREEYSTLHTDINTAKTLLLKALKSQTNTKQDIEQEISITFTASNNQFDLALKKINDELAKQTDAPFSTVPYDVVMDEKVQNFLETSEFRDAINDYVKKYGELLEKSKYFKKGTFNYYNATNVAKQLKDNGFFKAKHTVNLNADEKIEITSESQLENLINQEKDNITNDVELRKKYYTLEKQIQKNVTLREFETFLQNNESILPELSNIAHFKEKLWKSYIKANYELFQTLVEKMQHAASRIQEIEEQAFREETTWQNVINIFNDRFVVPFRLEVENKLQVILGKETAPRLHFVFKDGEDEHPVDRDSLLQTLSTGEKKAFYILNMLFDIEVRRQQNRETLVIVDDIADSFDYKNKYAIVQYLSDLSEDPCFKLLILTHNFDFYRTIESRKLVQRNNCFMVSKTEQGVTFQEAVGVKNIFLNLWKKEFFKNRKMKICCIPFMRNLIEYLKEDNATDFIKLTSLLHWKADSDKITVATLDEIYSRLFSTTGESPNKTDLVIDLINTEANSCIHAADGINFENKVILAIATRLHAEKFMTEKINDPEWQKTIHSNQTPALLKRYRTQFGDAKSIKVLQRVTLMTPENIHLNSFMYEPILDMSDVHLRRLYEDVLSLR
ncbi:hypothetical protein [Chromobacterium sp. Beijing]|uniref:hypothetical protein n=1 Tax=Chromobacterium sp. Beijing TaxID=2735795 RepID=UPI001F42E814|nr:hypothetical protein [Chromobacterium sp. Beijing]UJB33472.1 phage infection protein [Chromobacterium sp. Beijing]